VSPRRNLRRALAGVWTIALLVALLDPHPGVSSPFPAADKVVHFVLFAGYGALWTWAERGRVVAIVAAGVLLAGFTELAQQYWMPMRTGDLLDALFDVFGVACGVFVAHRVTDRPKTNAP